MYRPAALALLALMAALPASAQYRVVGEGECQPHRSDEVRCALRIEIPGGDTRYAVRIKANHATGSRAARMSADTYISTCGSGGRNLGRSNIGNSDTSQVATFTNERDQAGRLAQALFGFCVETFLTNCSMGGQAANCQQVINLGTTKIEVLR